MILNCHLNVGFALEDHIHLFTARNNALAVDLAISNRMKVEIHVFHVRKGNIKISQDNLNANCAQKDILLLALDQKYVLIV